MAENVIHVTVSSLLSFRQSFTYKVVHYGLHVIEHVVCLQVKYPLREPQVELLGLPVDDYVVRVRCRAQHSKLWSDWSVTLLMSIPPRQSAGTSAARRSIGADLHASDFDFQVFLIFTFIVVLIAVNTVCFCIFKLYFVGFS